MTKKMQAAVVERFGKPLSLIEVTIPQPGFGQILVKTEACGVCHTDLHAANGDWPLKPTLPFIPGHEGIGIVVALGAGVTAVKEGERVGVPWLYSACGHCEYCLAAREPVCSSAQFGGYTKNGGFAEFILADPNYVAHVPATLAARDAAPLICAGITSYKGIKETQAKPGEWIVISGVGGLGIWRSSMRRRWDCACVRSISMMENWRTPSALGRRRWSTPFRRTRSTLSGKPPVAARTAS